MFPSLGPKGRSGNIKVGMVGLALSDRVRGNCIDNTMHFTKMVRFVYFSDLFLLIKESIHKLFILLGDDEYTYNDTESVPYLYIDLSII